MSQDAPHAPDPRLARSRAAVLEAGVGLLVEGGPNAVTIDAVAHRSGVARTTIYRQWSSRDDLVADVIGEVVPDLPQVAAGEAFEPALRALVRESCAHAADDRWRRAFPALLLAKTQGQLALDGVRSEAMEDHQAQLEELLRRGVAEGTLSADVTLDDVLLQLMGPVVLITCALFDVDGTDRAVADRIVDTFLAAHRP